MTTIVVTGIGATSPIGGTARESWSALLAGESGARTLEQPWVAEHELPVTFAAQAKVRPEEVLERQEIKRLDPSAQFALIAAREAWADAGAPDIVPERILVDYATGIGGLWTLLDAWDVLKEKGPRRVLPMTIPMLMPNAAAAAISMGLGARAGARTVVSACASGTEAIANAYEHLQQGLADIVVAGGTEAVVHPLPIAAFASMQALSKRNDDPAHASRPFDASRDGFVLGEGGGVVVVESLEHALRRGARPIAEVIGGALPADAFHISAPEPTGRGAARAMTNALRNAEVTPAEIDYIVAHGTSTPLNDVTETRAIKAVFGEHARKLAVSSTKSMHGHLLGAAGAVELIATVMAVKEGVLPPTINQEVADPECDLDYVPNQARRAAVEVGLSNSFGFGGQNATVIVRRWQG